MTQASADSASRRGTSCRGHVLRLLPWFGVGLVVLWGTGAGDMQLASVAAACIGLALLPRAFTALSGIVFPGSLAPGILVFSAAALLAGELGGLYVTTFWWDIALHVIAAAMLAIVGMALVMIATGGARPHLAAWVPAVVAFGFAMMVGAMWELMEFSIDALFGTQTQRSGLPDTMGDQLANLVGAIIGAVAGYARIAHGANWPLSGMLGTFMAANPALYPRSSDETRGPQP